MRGRHLFEKRLSSPHPIFQKLSGGIAFIVPIKVIPTYFAYDTEKRAAACLF
jgi:hypothetical protein